jgi:predicted transcriptional regulator
MQNRITNTRSLENKAKQQFHNIILDFIKEMKSRDKEIESLKKKLDEAYEENRKLKGGK